MLEKTRKDLNNFKIQYHPAGGKYGKNIAEGSLNSDSIYVRPLTVYDSLGVQHDCRVGFAKLDYKIWAAEIYAAKNKDRTFDIQSTRADGLIAAGTLRFNGDGSLAYVSQSLKTPIEIVWKNYAFNSNITFDWGTAGVPPGTEGATVFGLHDGMRQVDAPFDQRFLDQNGIQSGFPGRFEADALSKLTNPTSSIATTLVHIGITLNTEAPIVEAADISLLSPEGLDTIGATHEVSETY
jgi:hypothetical protein